MSKLRGQAHAKTTPARLAARATRRTNCPEHPGIDGQATCFAAGALLVGNPLAHPLSADSAPARSPAARSAPRRCRRSRLPRKPGAWAAWPRCACWHGSESPRPRDLAAEGLSARSCSARNEQSDVIGARSPPQRRPQPRRRLPLTQGKQATAPCIPRAAGARRATPRCWSRHQSESRGSWGLGF